MFDPLCTKCERGRVFVKTKTIDYHHDSALKLVKRFATVNTMVGQFIQPSMVPKVCVQTHTKVANGQKGPRRGDPNWSCVFSTLPVLICACLQCRYMRKEQVILKTNSVARCSPKLDLGRAQKILGTTGLAVLA